MKRGQRRSQVGQQRTQSQCPTHARAHKRQHGKQQRFGDLHNQRMMAEDRIDDPDKDKLAGRTIRRVIGEVLEAQALRDGQAYVVVIQLVVKAVMMPRSGNQRQPQQRSRNRQQP